MSIRLDIRHWIGIGNRICNSLEKSKLARFEIVASGGSELVKPFRTSEHLGNLRSELSFLNAHILELLLLLLLANFLHHSAYRSGLEDSAYLPPKAHCLHQLLHPRHTAHIVTVVLLRNIPAEVFLDHRCAVIGEHKNHPVGLL